MRDEGLRDRWMNLEGLLMISYLEIMVFGDRDSLGVMGGRQIQALVNALISSLVILSVVICFHKLELFIVELPILTISQSS